MKVEFDRTRTKKKDNTLEKMSLDWNPKDSKGGERTKNE